MSKKYRVNVMVAVDVTVKAGSNLDDVADSIADGVHIMMCETKVERLTNCNEDIKSVERFAVNVDSVTSMK